MWQWWVGYAGSPHHSYKHTHLHDSHLLFPLLSSLWANQKLILLEDWESMKMVDGSTVRHRRVDCSYQERVIECRVWGMQGWQGLKRVRKKQKWAGRRGDVREKGGKGWWRTMWIFHSRAAIKEKREERAGRNLSIIFLFVVKLSFRGRWSYATRIRSDSDTHCCSKGIEVHNGLPGWLRDWYQLTVYSFMQYKGILRLTLF